MEALTGRYPRSGRRPLRTPRPSQHPPASSPRHRRAPSFRAPPPRRAEHTAHQAPCVRERLSQSPPHLHSSTPSSKWSSHFLLTSFACPSDSNSQDSWFLSNQSKRPISPSLAFQAPALSFVTTLDLVLNSPALESPASQLVELGHARCARKSLRNPLRNHFLRNDLSDCNTLRLGEGNVSDPLCYAVLCCRRITFTTSTIGSIFGPSRMHCFRNFSISPGRL